MNFIVAVSKCDIISTWALAKIRIANEATLKFLLEVYLTPQQGNCKTGNRAGNLAWMLQKKVVCLLA